MAIYGSTNFELVGDFMESMDQDIFLDPEFPDEHTQRLRINLIEEELDELQSLLKKAYEQEQALRNSD